MSTLRDSPSCSVSAAGFEDGLGLRSVHFDREVGGLYECLRLRPELGLYEPLLARAAAAIAVIDDERIGRLTRITRDDGRVLVLSELVNGERLADLLEVRRDDDSAPGGGVDAALGLLLQALPALARLHAAGVVHGVLSPARILITPTSQVVLLEAVYADAVARLRLRRHKIWTDFGVLAPRTAGAVRLDARMDVSQLALAALAVAVGRPRGSESFPDLASLLEEVTEVAQIRVDARFAAAFVDVLQQALSVVSGGAGLSADALAAQSSALAEAIGANTALGALADLLRYQPAALEWREAQSDVSGEPPSIVTRRVEPVRIEPKPEPVAIRPAPPAPAVVVPDPPPPVAIEPASPPAVPVIVERTPLPAPEQGFAAVQPPPAPTPAPPAPPFVAPPPVAFAPPRPQVTLQPAPIPTAVAAPPAAIAVAPPAPPTSTVAPAPSPAAPALKIKSETPSGYAPPRPTDTPETRVRALPFVQRGNEAADRPGFPWKLAAAAVLAIAVATMAGREYLHGRSEPPVATSAAPAAAPTPVAATTGATGSLSIDSQPQGARVTIDGADAGVTPLVVSSIAAGRHHIAFITDSGTVRRSIRVEAGKQLALDVPVYAGWIAVFAPIPLHIAEGNRAIGTTETGRIMLSPGRHTLTFTNAELSFSARESVEIVAGEERAINLDPKAVVNLNAVPWAEVWVDGARAGETPLANLMVRLGTREFVFKHPQYGERKIVTTINATGTAVSVDLTKPSTRP